MSKVSEPDKRKRRQFLADALFAGGSLAAAALLARHFAQPEPVVAQTTPTPTPTPSSTPTSCPPDPNRPVPGEMVAPPIEGKVAPATPAPTTTPSIRGDAK